MEFIDLEDPRINISDKLKIRLQEIEGEPSLSPITQNDISSTEDIFKLAKSQYLIKDDKWIITLNRYLQDKAVSLARSKIYDDAIVCYIDCLNLLEVLKEKYISSRREDLSEKISLMIKGIIRNFLGTYAFKLFINIPHIEFDNFEQRLKLELKKLGKFEISDDDIKFAFFLVGGDFPGKINTDDLRNSILNLEDKSCLESARYCLRKKQRTSRKQIFENWPGTPSINRDYLRELNEGQMLLVDISRRVGDKIGELTDLAELYEYKAYSENRLEDIIENFDQSISILSNLVDQHPEDESMSRSLIFTKARKAEYLAFFYQDLGERIKQLKRADGFYGLVNDPRSFLASFLSTYYSIKKHIIDDQDIYGGIDIAVKLCGKSEKLTSLCQKYPDVETLIYTCLLVHYYPGPVTPPSDSKLKKLNIIYEKIADKMKSLYPLWSVVNSYNSLIHSMGDNKALSKYFKEAFIAFIKSGKISDMEKVAERLFFVTLTEDVSQEFIEIIGKEEGQELEFKGSFGLNVKKFLFTNKITFETELENEALAAIVGFLNASGGILILGVLEKQKDLPAYKDRVSEKFNKLIFGVEREYPRDGYDGFIRRMEDILRKRIDPNLPSLLKIKKNLIDEHDLVQITIPKGEKWYYLDNEVFFVREHNQTMTKKGGNADEYKLQRAR